MTWRDRVITPLVEVALCALALACTAWLRRRCSLEMLESVALFYAIQMAWAVLFLRLLWWAVPLREGVHRLSSTQRYVYMLTGLIQYLNLSPWTHTTSVSPIIRQLFYRLLGARLGTGMIIVAGRLTDPTLVSIGDDAIIGDDSLLLCHVQGVRPAGDHFLLLGRIEIDAGAIVGARAVLMPGVRVGEHAMVNAMSLVPMNTRIPAGEVWGGSPACKVGDVRRPAVAERRSA